MATPTACEVSEEQRAKAQHLMDEWLGTTSGYAGMTDEIAQALAQEAQRANGRAEGLAKELEALRAELDEELANLETISAINTQLQRQLNGAEQKAEPEWLADLKGRARAPDDREAYEDDGVGGIEVVRRPFYLSVKPSMMRELIGMTARVAELEKQLAKLREQLADERRIDAVAEAHTQREIDRQREHPQAHPLYVSGILAGREEARRECDAVTERYAPGGKGSPIPTTWPEVASRMCSDRIRVLPAPSGAPLAVCADPGWHIEAVKQIANLRAALNDALTKAVQP